MNVIGSGYNARLSPEFSNHSATIAMFPFRNDIWRDYAKYAQQLLLDAIKIISKHEKVFLVTNRILDSHIQEQLNSNIEIIKADYDDIWARDISPFFPTINGRMYGICFGFNAWGGIDEGSYFPWDKDAAFGNAICDYLDIQSIPVDLIMEGGALIHNGEGLAIVTESVLLNKNRNPGVTKEEFEFIFRQLLGIEKVIWIKRGFVYDETDGHIDVFMNFTDQHNLMIAWTKNRENAQYKILHDAYNVLLNATTLDGKKLCIHQIPLPDPMYITEEEAMGIEKNSLSIDRTVGFPLYPTYNNAYVFNGGVLVPQFNVRQDNVAVQYYKELFPERIIYPLYSKEFLIGGGNFHCIFHEIPEV